MTVGDPLVVPSGAPVGPVTVIVPVSENWTRICGFAVVRPCAVGAIAVSPTTVAIAASRRSILQCITEIVAVWTSSKRVRKPSGGARGLPQTCLLRLARPGDDRLA